MNIKRESHPVSHRLNRVLSIAFCALISWNAMLTAPRASAADVGSKIAANRPGQSRTLLPDGRWLLVGGNSDQGVESLIQIQQGALIEAFPKTLQWARSGHTATVLPGGQVFIFGGTGPDDRLVSTAELIDPVNGTVEALPPTGLGPRTQHSAVLLTQGLVLIAGGHDGDGNALSSAQLWDPRTSLVLPNGSSLLIARFAHEAELLATGEGYIWGGQDKAGQVLQSGEIFNPWTGFFEPAVTQLDARGQVSAPASVEPSVAESIPAANAQDVELDVQIAIRFGKLLPVSQLNAGTLSLIGPSGPVAAKVTGAERGMLAFVTPEQELLPATTYTLFVAGIMDENDRTLPLTSVRFTTHRIEAASASIPPSTGAQSLPAQVSRPATSPATAASEVNKRISARPLAQTPRKLMESPPESRASEDLNEDWVPQAENRHGSWRVLGLAHDPPFVSVANATSATLSAASHQTAVAGNIQRLNGRPLPGVKVRVGKASTVTDADGRFVLAGLSAGATQLAIDGTAVWINGRHYTEHFLSLNVIAGATTTIPKTIFLPRVDPTTEVSISSPADHEIVLTHPSIPGLEVHIPKGAVLRQQNGKIVSKVSITPIPVDRAPYPTAIPFSVYFTLQPGGAYVDGDPSNAIKIIYPNYQGLSAGTNVDFWNYDPTAGGWQVYGHGKVSANGKQVIADESVGFRQIMTFGFGIGQTNGRPNSGPTANGCHVAEPVDCGTGLFYENRTDMVVNDVIPISVTRMYRTNDNQPHLFGMGFNLSYAMWLYQDPSWQGQGDKRAELVRADGSRIEYVSSGSSGYPWINTTSPTEFNGSTITANETTLTWDLTLRDGTVMKFAGVNPPNQLISITDPHGNTVTITSVGTALNEYSNAPPIAQVTSPNGRYIQFFYDGDNRIIRAIDNTGRAVSYTYDSLGRLATAVDADAHTEKYGYDATTNNLNLVTDRRGNAATKNVFDANGRVKTQTLADGAVWGFSYILDGNNNVIQTTVTDPRSYVRQHYFNASGYPTKTILAQGTPEQQTFATVFTAANLPLSVTDTLGRETLYGYNSVGQVTSVTKLAGTAGAITYLMTYDPNYHQLTSVTDPLGHTASATLGVAGNITGINDALGNSATIGYNSQGLPTAITDPLGHTTQLGFAEGADLSTVLDPLSRQTQSFEDAVGRLRSIIDPLGNTTQYTQDPMDRLTSVIDAMGGTTSLTYDQNGNLLTVKDPKNVTQTFTYDSRDRGHTYLDPAGKTETFNFDGMGNLISKIDRKLQTTSITYDGINRPVLVTFQDNSTITITWDSGDRATKFVDSTNGTVSRVYDLLDRMTQETTPQGVVNYTYDNAGRRATMTVAGQPTINYTFDNDDRLTQVQQGSNVLAFGYDAAGRRTTITLPNNIVGTFGFDNADELTSISYANGSTTVGSLGYGYDLGGNRTSMTGTLAGFVPPNVVPSFSYDGTNRLTSRAGSALSYDANGNLSGFGSTTYTWNARDQLTATSAGGAIFGYDALGRRVSTTVSGVTTPYLYDGQNPAMISSNQMLSGAGIDEVYAQINSTGTTSVLRDGLNSAVAVTNSSAATTANYAYSPYGDSSSTGTSSTPLQFTGRENDGATGLYYYRARYYSPQLGRFIAEDPIGLGGGTNYYAYAHGNPIMYGDPYGLYSVDEFVDDAANFSAGWGDMLSFGITAQIRNGVGIGAVNKCSTAYNGGEVFGFANGVALGWAQGTKAVAKAASGNNWANFSHSLFPKRFLKKFDNPVAAWMNQVGNRLNGDFVTPALHTRMDAAVFGLGEEWFAANPLFSPLRQLINRVPYVPGATLYGAGSAAMNGCGCN